MKRSKLLPGDVIMNIVGPADITYSYIPKSDAVLFLLDAGRR